MQIVMVKILRYERFMPLHGTLEGLTKNRRPCFGNAERDEPFGRNQSQFLTVGFID